MGNRFVWLEGERGRKVEGLDNFLSRPIKIESPQFGVKTWVKMCNILDEIAQANVESSLFLLSFGFFLHLCCCLIFFLIFFLLCLSFLFFFSFLFILSSNYLFVFSFLLSWQNVSFLKQLDGCYFLFYLIKI